MKLKEILLSAPAWAIVGRLKKNPKLAYRFLKYEKKVQKELDVIEKQRVAYIYECAGIEVPVPGVDVKLEEGTEGLKQFSEKFEALLMQDSDLDWIGITMDDFIEALDAERGNVLSERDIELLEPFFTERAKPDLKLVAKE